MDPRTALFLCLQEYRSRTSRGGLESLYPDHGPLRRELYFKHMLMLAAGREFNERACLGGNRVGKTLSIGGYETAAHLTGLYPPWWKGHRYDHPILAWAAGTKATKVRNVNQKFLLGALQQMQGFTKASGGLIPSRSIVRLTRKTGVSDAVDQAIIRHVHGYENLVEFKSYEEGRSAFEAEGVDWIWLDEEPKREIYDECLLRILTTRGRILSTFTPLEGITETVMAMLEDTDLL